MDTSMTIVWVVLLVMLIIIELATMGLTTIWFAGGALVAAIAAGCGAPIYVQLILMVVVSVILLTFTRPVAVKYFNKDRAKTNVEALIGQKAVVTGDIDNVEGYGQASVSGQIWTARSTDDNVTIKKGEIVEIMEIRGVKLIVRPAKRTTVQSVNV